MKVGDLVKWLLASEPGFGTIVEIYGSVDDIFMFRVMWINNINDILPSGEGYDGHWYGVTENWDITVGSA